MAVLKAFRGIRPQQDKAAAVASRPYDVLNREEAMVEAQGNPWSFLHVVKPEIDLPASTDEHSPEVYVKGSDNFQRFIQQGVFSQDAEDCLYVYAQTMEGRTQYGIVGCAAVEDYLHGVILKHELTRPDKEEDRKNHVRVSGMHYEPVFFAYPAVKEIDQIVDSVIANKPEYDFVSVDGFGHHFWIIKDHKTIDRLISLFAKIPNTYVADGHHRTAAAALVGKEKKENNPQHTGNEEYNYFLAVHFPDNQLKIIDYNRVITDLNGLSKEEFLKKIQKGFILNCEGSEIYHPKEIHEFSMYMDGKWYSLKAKPGTFNDQDPIGSLDVTVLSNEILAPVLNITDLRKSKRIDFVGGIRGLAS